MGHEPWPRVGWNRREKGHTKRNDRVTSVHYTLFVANEAGERSVAAIDHTALPAEVNVSLLGQEDETSAHGRLT